MKAVTLLVLAASSLALQIRRDEQAANPPTIVTTLVTVAVTYTTCYPATVTYQAAATYPPGASPVSVTKTYPTSSVVVTPASKELPMTIYPETLPPTLDGTLTLTWITELCPITETTYLNGATQTITWTSCSTTTEYMHYTEPPLATTTATPGTGPGAYTLTTTALLPTISTHVHPSPPPLPAQPSPPPHPRPLPPAPPVGPSPSPPLPPSPASPSPPSVSGAPATAVAGTITTRNGNSMTVAAPTTPVRGNGAPSSTASLPSPAPAGGESVQNRAPCMVALMVGAVGAIMLA